MNKNCRSLAILLLAAVIGAGCASSSSSSANAPMSSPMKRIDANREAYESWPIEVRMAILDQRVIRGMTREQVIMAVGEPSDGGTRMGRDGQVEEVWIYRTGGGGGSNVLSSVAQNVMVGTRVGGVGVSTRGVPGGGGGGAAPIEQGQVVFVDGIVVDSNVGP